MSTSHFVMDIWNDPMDIADILPQTVSLESIAKVECLKNMLVFNFPTSLGLIFETIFDKGGRGGRARSP